MSDDRNWTAEQQALFAAAEEGETHLLGEAVAGAGKTTAAVEVAKRVNAKTKRFVAFNAHIARELRDRLGSEADACTLHSLGRRALLRDVSGMDPEVRDNKYAAIVRQQWPEETWERNGQPVCRPPARALLDLFDACRCLMVSPGDGLEAVAEAGERMGVEYADTPNGDSARVLLPRLERLWEAGLRARCHDFTDMLWMPVVNNYRVERSDLLLVDEAQDFSPLMRQLAYRACGGGRMAVLGDRRQSIYAFTGADPSSIPVIEASLGDSDRGLAVRPLTVTFRCPESHVQAARLLVPQIRARVGAKPGVLRTIDEEELIGLARPGDLILSRRNAPLLTLALRFLSEGIPFKVVGRDLTSKLLTTLKKVHVGGAKGINDLLVGLDDWQIREQEKADRKGASEAVLQGIADTALCLRTLAAGQPTIAALEEFIKFKLAIKDEDAAGATALVRGSSVHRAKGLEAERTFLIDTQCMPLFFPCRRCNGTGREMGSISCTACNGRGSRQTEIEAQQEANLLYVALTRSKSEMYFVGGTPTGIAF